jgi:hypothetical protein
MKSDQPYTTSYQIDKLREMFPRVHYQPTIEEWQLSQEDLNKLYLEKRNEFYALVDAISAEKRK